VTAALDWRPHEAARVVGVVLYVDTRARNALARDSSTRWPEDSLKRSIKLGIAGLVALAMLALAALPVVFDRERDAFDPGRAVGGQDRYRRLSDGVTYYEIAGPLDGPPVLLVHGFSVPSFVWDPTFDALADAGFRVVRYDLYGRGMSDRPAGDYDRARYERQITELLGSLGIAGPVDLVGLSMGGALVAGYAQRHPERVRRLVLVAPFNTPRDIGPLAWPVVGDWLFRVDVLPSLAEGQLADFAHPERFPDWPERYREQMRYHGFGHALLSTLRHVIAHDPVLAYGTVGAQGKPVLLIWGERDGTVPYAQHARVRAEIPHAEFLSVPDAGHLPHKEQPQVVEPALIEFLRRP
jgi:pimeloyl-ACP methyl ester carboxylesterase